MVVFNSPEASYQYDTGFPASIPGRGTSQPSSSARLTLPSSSTAATPPPTREIKKAAAAITENRIKLGSSSLYSYKVVDERPATTFIRQKSTPVTSTTVIKKAPQSKKAKKALPKYGATFVTTTTRAKKSPVVIAPAGVTKRLPR